MKMDALFIVVLMAIAAIVLYFWKDMDDVDEVSSDPNARDTVGASSIPNPEGTPIGPMYLVYNKAMKPDISVARFIAMPVATQRMQ
jgi:hypothetical protein